MDDMEMDYEMQNSPDSLRQLHPPYNASYTNAPLGCLYTPAAYLPPADQPHNGYAPVMMPPHFLSHPQYQGQPPEPPRVPEHLRRLQQEQQQQQNQHLQQFLVQRQRSFYQWQYPPIQFPPGQQPGQQPESQRQQQQEEAPLISPPVSPPSLSNSPENALLQSSPPQPSANSGASSASGSSGSSSGTSEANMSGARLVTPPVVASTEPAGQQNNNQQPRFEVSQLSQLSPLSPLPQPSAPSQPDYHSSMTMANQLPRPGAVGQQLASQPSWSANFLGNQPTQQQTRMWLNHHVRHTPSGFHTPLPTSGNNSTQPAQPQLQPQATATVTTTITTTATTVRSPSTMSVVSPEHSPVSPIASPIDTAAEAAAAATLRNITDASAPVRRASARSGGRRSARWDHSRNPSGDGPTPYYISSSDESDTEAGPQYLANPYFGDTGSYVREAETRVHAQQVFRGSISNRRVASKSAVSSLESIVIDSLDEGERMCIICYNDFGTESPEGINEVPLRLPKCKHVFGNHCIKKWLKENDSCPYCRDKLESESQMHMPRRALDNYLRAPHALIRRDQILPSGQFIVQFRRPSIYNNSYVRTATTEGSTGVTPGGNQGAAATAAGSNNVNSTNSTNNATGRSTVLGERRAAPPTESTEESRRRTRRRHINFRSTSTTIETPLNTIINPGGPQRRSAVPPSTAAASAHFQLNAQVQSFRPSLFGAAQPPPQASGYQQTGLQGPSTSTPLSTTSIYYAQQTSRYSSQLPRPRFPTQSAQTPNPNTASTNNSDNNSNNSSSNNNNSGGPCISGWSPQVLPPPAPSSTGLPTDASRPIFTSPFNYQIPQMMRHNQQATYNHVNMPLTRQPTTTTTTTASVQGPAISPTLPPLLAQNMFLAQGSAPANHNTNSMH